MGRRPVTLLRITAAGGLAVVPYGKIERHGAGDSAS